MDAESGAPKDELAPETLSWFKTLGVDYKNLNQVIAAGPCPKVKLTYTILNIDHNDSDLSFQTRVSIFFCVDKINFFVNSGICCYQRRY